ncbi:MAG TPA: acyl carrier protein [Planctomycetota bacterium]|jgi:acyl carrier protein|nr:acyl carrier protein [Planctomycetota bacterium]
MSNATLADLKTMLEKSTGTKASTITLDSKLEDLGLASADQASFAASVQKKYKVEIKAAELTKMKTVGDFYRRINSKS